jgi:Helix-turn-helix
MTRTGDDEPGRTAAHPPGRRPPVAMDRPEAAAAYEQTRLRYELAETVRLRREELGWSQRQLAERAGMSPARSPRSTSYLLIPRVSAGALLAAGFRHGSGTRTRSPVVVRACGPYLRRHIAVSVHRSRAQTGDYEDDPHYDHRVADVLAGVLADDGHKAGKPGADPGAEEQRLALA